MSSAPHAFRSESETSAVNETSPTSGVSVGSAPTSPGGAATPRSAPPPPPSRPPGRAQRLSDVPPIEQAERLAEQLLDPVDREFLSILRASGLLGELEGDELLRVASSVSESRSGVARRIDLLESYYAAGGDAARARTRRERDRFFLQRTDEPVTASQIVARLSELTPELGPIAIERIGAGDDALLVLRAGDHFAALLTDYEESLDTDEIDLRDIEERRSGQTMVTLRGLVHAVNVLLDRKGVRERLIALRSDEAREVYVATSIVEAIELARRGWLEDEHAEDVMELGSW